MKQAVEIAFEFVLGGFGVGRVAVAEETEQGFEQRLGAGDAVVGLLPQTAVNA